MAEIENVKSYWALHNVHMYQNIKKCLKKVLLYLHETAKNKLNIITFTKFIMHSNFILKWVKNEKETNRNVMNTKFPKIDEKKTFQTR